MIIVHKFLPVCRHSASGRITWNVKSLVYSNNHYDSGGMGETCNVPSEICEHADSCACVMKT